MAEFLFLGDLALKKKDLLIIIDLGLYVIMDSLNITFTESHPYDFKYS